jgi:hypothetical protein
MRLAFALFLCLVGCEGSPTECKVATDCNPAHGSGECLLGQCAYTDATCASGYRFGITGKCAPLPDAGPGPDASTSD